jgi:hypothetical protein
LVLIVGVYVSLSWTVRGCACITVLGNTLALQMKIRRSPVRVKPSPAAHALATAALQLLLDGPSRTPLRRGGWERQDFIYLNSIHTIERRLCASRTPLRRGPWGRSHRSDLGRDTVRGQRGQQRGPRAGASQLWRWPISPTTVTCCGAPGRLRETALGEMLKKISAIARSLYKASIVGTWQNLCRVFLTTLDHALRGHGKRRSRA